MVSRQILLGLRSRLAGVQELMDGEGLDAAEVAEALRTLGTINRIWGGLLLMRRELASVLPGVRGPVRILDVATGWADMPRALARWARHQGLPVEIVCLDHSEMILQIAARESAKDPELRFQQGDALALPFPDGSFDVVTASLVLHHMEGDGAVRLLTEAWRVARRAVIINDLRRGILPYLVSTAALYLLSKNRLIRSDGLLSVRRSYTAQEMLALARQAGWKMARARRYAFFRLALVGLKEGPGGPP